MLMENIDVIISKQIIRIAVIIKSILGDDIDNNLGKIYNTEAAICRDRERYRCYLIEELSYNSHYAALLGNDATKTLLKILRTEERLHFSDLFRVLAYCAGMAGLKKTETTIAPALPSMPTLENGPEACLGYALAGLIYDTGVGAALLDIYDPEPHICGVKILNIGSFLEFSHTTGGLNIVETQERMLDYLNENIERLALYNT
ncbi:hypothetical protein [Acetobacter persici]|nr:hypothetical protein [Acetobacter persici]